MSGKQHPLAVYIQALKNTGAGVRKAIKGTQAIQRRYKGYHVLTPEEITEIYNSHQIYVI